MIEKIRSLGTLRIMLDGLALAFILAMPLTLVLPKGEAVDLIFHNTIPALAPLVFVVLMLDVMMSSVWKDGAEQERIQQLNLVIKVHLVVAFTLLGIWMAVYLPTMLV